MPKVTAQHADKRLSLFSKTIKRHQFPLQGTGEGGRKKEDFQHVLCKVLVPKP